ncbi:MAG TPA: glycine zipper domain-containing protein [Candidatus Acidoferrum sp.]|nr:glycine zipper domain-containing protein [Candidatus Acidoferrum sp.]
MTKITRTLSLAVAVAAAALIGGCVTQPVVTVPPIDASLPATAAPATQVFVYPNNGQSDAQLDRDRYECHQWAVKQSGYDPSETRLAPHQRVQVVSTTPPGAGTATGAIAGAIIGSATAGRHDSGAGAVVGAVAGAIIGAAADASQQEQTARIQQRYDQRDNQLNARMEQQSNGYRRALSACLEGRGYTVK